ncbi:MAG: molecular chaperone HtpG [Eubacteriales bacterium]|jgi:molecular chaperone HtpG|nr:molecular chaperone HtpG [Eubacteriales bacterium]
MAKKQFRAESRRILDLMIDSIYTHKEIFLRELISNASDAIDKLYFLSLTDDKVGKSREDFEIRITADKDKRILTISDNGIGMTKQELDENLGTIAKSGTLAFKKEHDVSDAVDIIGQFGVGFYSSFMVANEVRVLSRAYGSDEAWLWESAGRDGYTITKAEKPECGTIITLEIKPNTEDEQYDRFLSQHTISQLVKQYSDYIRYPIRMESSHARAKNGDPGDTETVTEDETLNSQIPIWKKAKSELTETDYNAFYKSKFHDYEDPLLTIHFSGEGVVSYDALLYIPKNPPYDFYAKEYQRGLQLYSSGVLIMEKCADLLPDYFGFVSGLVDSSDLSLNISRELLQHDRQLKTIAVTLKKRIKSELKKLMDNDREKYEAFYKSFRLPVKYGLYSDYGMNKDFLSDLVLYHSAAENKLVSLKEYVDAMKEDQKHIYYVSAETVERAMKLPQTERVRDQGYDILCMTDDVDEFAVRMLATYMEKTFKSVSDADLNLVSDEEKQAQERAQEENKDILDALKASLSGKVKDVRLSDRLKSSPVCLTSDGPLSIEMEKVLASMPVSDGSVKAERVLEINPAHPVFAILAKLGADDARVEKYASLLYDQALLIEGLPIEDPVAFSNAICELMV